MYICIYIEREMYTERDIQSSCRRRRGSAGGGGPGGGGPRAANPHT